MDITEFSNIVNRAVEELPEEFTQKLDNVDILVEPWPTVYHLRSAGIQRGQTLLGLYQGVPQPKRRGGFQLPDKITIFMGPILALAKTPENLQEEIKRVVKHEIAHHFGMDETSIRRTGH